MVRIETSAPGRCGILGNPSDIYGGAVLSCSIPARNRCILEFGPQTAPLPDSRLWNAVMSRLPITGYRVSYETNIPRSSGLSGSTAMMAAMTLAALVVRGEAPDLSSVDGRTTLAELARDIERYDAKIVCGFQDAYMIAHGGLQLMEFPGKHPITPGPHGQLQSINAKAPFLLITTGVERLSGSVHGPMIDRWLAGEPDVVETMLALPHLAREGAVALQQENWTLVGEMMLENHQRIAALGGSGEPIDKLINDCLQNGATGAKLAGAGLGGTVIALTENANELRDRLEKLGYTQFMVPAPGEGCRVDVVLTA